MSFPLYFASFESDSVSLVCVKYIFLALLKKFDSKGILCTLKKVLCQPHNVLTLQVSLSLHEK